MKSLEKEAKRLIRIAVQTAIKDIWETPLGQEEFHGGKVDTNRGFLSLLEEDTMYEISRALELPQEIEAKYMRLLIDAFGEYSSDKPFENLKKTFYNGFYFRATD